MPQTNPISPIVCILLATLILCTAAFLRFYDLEDRPLHFDEATGARIVGYALAGDQQPFDPQHFHGPLLSVIAAPLAELLGQNNWRDLTIYPLRSVTAIAGFLTVAICLFFPSRWSFTLAAAALISTSPLLVYYSRMYIHEPLFIFTGILSLLAIAKYCEKQKMLWAVLGGIAIGLMAATRETVIIALFSWTAAGLIMWLQVSRTRKLSELINSIRRHQWRIGLAGITCMATIFIFYSQFGRHPSGFIDFFRTFFVYETTPGHDKPWDYYLSLLVVPQRSMGVLWTEAAVLILAVSGYFLSPKGLPRQACRFIFTSGIILFLVFSLISYKTPWLICLAWLHICIAGAFGLSGIAHFIPNRSVPLTVILISFIIGWQGLQAYRAAFDWPNDNRNPYSYVPTSPDVVRMTRWLKELSKTYPQINEQTHVVLGQAYWPLPWYLKDLGQTGYYTSVKDIADLPGTPLIFTTGKIPPEAESSHQWLPRGLRHEVTLWLGVRKDIWQTYQSDE
ncbi:MAG: flippase activity-associated protein Agl23 [Verrucomicrobiota bacterium]